MRMGCATSSLCNGVAQKGLEFQSQDGGEIIRRTKLDVDVRGQMYDVCNSSYLTMVKIGPMSSVRVRCEQTGLKINQTIRAIRKWHRNALPRWVATL